MWHCGGRLPNTEIPYAAKYPILLPRSDPLTSLIVKLTNASATTVCGRIRLREY